MAESVKRSKPRWKRWLFRLLTLCITLFLLEIVCSLLWAAIFSAKTWDVVRREQQELAERAGTSADAAEAIHPYLGWAYDPKSMQAAEVSDGRTSGINELGLVDDKSSVVKRAPGQVIVGICGGSVAQDLTFMGLERLRSGLAALPEYRGKEIRLVRLAMSGYKQPQQLMALNYLLALGGELDVLINVDGFNEIALAVDENFNADVFMAYPRKWHHRLQDVVDPRTTSISYQLLTNRASRQSVASTVRNSWLRYSRTANFFWILYDRWLWSRQLSLGEELQKFQNDHGRSFAKSGPKNSEKDREAAIDGAIKLWLNCSRQLHRSCTANGIRYMHVLQPNQYHADSKPLTEEERKKFYTPDENWGTLIHDAYPKMLTASKELVSDGVRFRDLTQVFKKETATIYRDYFCHYNQRGNELLADAVVKALQDDSKSQEP